MSVSQENNWDLENCPVTLLGPRMYKTVWCILLPKSKDTEIFVKILSVPQEPGESIFCPDHGILITETELMATNH